MCPRKISPQLVFIISFKKLDKNWEKNAMCFWYFVNACNWTKRLKIHKSIHMRMHDRSLGLSLSLSLCLPLIFCLSFYVCPLIFMPISDCFLPLCFMALISHRLLISPWLRCLSSLWSVFLMSLHLFPSLFCLFTSFFLSPFPLLFNAFLLFLLSLLFHFPSLFPIYLITLSFISFLSSVSFLFASFLFLYLSLFFFLCLAPTDCCKWAHGIPKPMSQMPFCQTWQEYLRKTKK